MPQSPTPNMNLIKPTELGDNGQWAALLDAMFDLIDQHSHSVGQGVQVPVAGIDVNADMSWHGQYAATNLVAADFAPIPTTSVTGYACALFANSADNELYWRTSGGTNVKLTSGTGINVSLVGGIGGDYASVGALLDFVDANDTFHFYQQVGSGVRQYAGVAHGNLDIFQQIANPTGGVPANRVRLKSPASLAASLDLTLPPALPSATTLLAIDATGVITAPSPTVTLGNNVNIQLQGTGKIKHGTRSAEFNLGFNTAVTLSGTGPSQPAGVPGAVCPINSQNMFPLPGIQDHWQISSLVITLGAGSPANAPTYDLFFSDTGLGSASFSHSGVTSVTSAATQVTVTLNTSYTSPVWLSVQTFGSTVHVKSCTVNYIVP